MLSVARQVDALTVARIRRVKRAAQTARQAENEPLTESRKAQLLSEMDRRTLLKLSRNP